MKNMFSSTNQFFHEKITCFLEKCYFSMKIYVFNWKMYLCIESLQFSKDMASMKIKFFDKEIMFSMKKLTF